MHSRFFKLAAVAAIGAFVVASAAAQQPQPSTPQQYEPQRGQPGKDVMWIPTPDRLVEMMLDKAQVTKDDVVYDLGSGDGRLVIAAAKRGATAVGVEYNPKMVELAKETAEKAGVKATFVRGDIFEEDFSRATVLTLFLLDELNFQLRPKILAMKPGTRVVSNTFHMADWEADATIGPVDANCGAYCTAYYWIVPAKADGAWQTGDGLLILTQTFQMLKGTLGTGSDARTVSGNLAGNIVTLDVGGETFSGEIDGNRLRLASKGGRPLQGTRQ